MARLWAPLRKVEENGDDGTLTIEGIASTESVDAQGEVITAAAIKAALPGFMRGGSGALREMHAMSAAGRVDTAEVGADGVTTIKATVVDESAIRKVRLGVYKGLSVGGRALKRDPKNAKIITALALTEISLVDRPANPDAVLTLFKADASAPALDAETIKAALAELPAHERAAVLMRAVHKVGGREISARAR